MIISTGTADKAMEISLFIYETTGVKYETHSTGFCTKVSLEHAELIRENFKGQGVFIDYKPI